MAISLMHDLLGIIHFGIPTIVFDAVHYIRVLCRGAVVSVNGNAVFCLIQNQCLPHFAKYNAMSIYHELYIAWDFRNIIHVVRFDWCLIYCIYHCLMFLWSIGIAGENSLSFMTSNIRSSGGDARYHSIDAPRFMSRDIVNGLISALNQCRPLSISPADVLPNASISIATYLVTDWVSEKLCMTLKLRPAQRQYSSVCQSNYP